MKGGVVRFLVKAGALIAIWIGLLTWELSLVGQTPFLLMACALFFSFYFLVPVWSYGKLLYIAAALVVVGIHYGLLAENNIYPFLIYYYLLWESLSLSQGRESYVIGTGIVICSLIPFLGQVLAVPLFFHLFLVALFIMTGIKSNEWYRVAEERKELYTQLSEEYRRLKQQTYTNEQNVRDEERDRIARDMHDSVGHKLTALLMQVEVLWQQKDEEERKLLTTIKELARESLAETRAAVQALNKSEIHGLASVWHLIRKLEMGSRVSVNFTARQGALSVPLSSDKCVAIYRGIQESLTNAMRHAFAGEVAVTLDVPGRKWIRFHVINRIQKPKPLNEGFGLKTLRERVERVGGKVEIFQTEKNFVVSGTIPVDENKDKGEGGAITIDGAMYFARH